MWRFLLACVAIFVWVGYSIVAILFGHTTGWAIGIVVTAAAAVGAMFFNAFAPRD